MDMRDTISNYFYPRPSLLLGGLAPVLTLVIGSLIWLSTGSRPAGVSAQELGKLNRFIQKASASDDALKAFRQGRDLIEDENWDRAAATFNSFVSEYPKHKDVDAALYWLAFALKKQGKPGEADRQLERLIRDYPRSSWIDDARAMRVEIAGQTGNSQVVDKELNRNDLEIKMIALQSLFQSNPDRAAALVVEILKADSGADRRLKENAIALLGQHSGRSTIPMLIELARTQTDSKLRKTAIFWLGQSGDDKAFDLLKDLTKQSSDMEVAKAALFALAQHSSPRAYELLVELARTASSTQLRREAIFWIGQRGQEGAIDDLMKIYETEQDTEVKKHILFSLAQHHSPRAIAKLYEVVKSNADVEVRKQAIFWIGQEGGEQAIGNLIQLYESEKEDRIKEQLIFAFGQSGQKTALRKLMQIAKSDASIDMRKKAIFWLGQNGDPEAAKFLEEILK